jgi:Zn-dependent protease with chaperone function
MQPSRFHQRLHETLAAQEPGLFRWYSSDEYETERADRMRLELLRSSYRLSAETHERPHRIVREAAAKLEIDLPITLYQLHDTSQANAALFFVRDEVHIVLSGSVLNTLDDLELAALFGHELAHHHLFTLDGGVHRVTAELVEATASHTGAATAFAESALRNRRWTEIFADRGAALVTGRIEPAISCLVKIGTGLTRVSASDYLDQAREVVARLAAQQAVRGESHPEHAVRAIALEMWDATGDNADEEIARLVEGVVELEALDLIQQRDLVATTRALLDLVLAPGWMRTEATLAHARRYFPDYEWRAADRLVVTPGLEDYFSYVLLDFAAVDAALGEVGLAQALGVANELGVRDPFAKLARKEMKAVALDTLEARSAKLFEAAARQEHE